jgi:hypothetical protein
MRSFVICMALGVVACSSTSNPSDDTPPRFGAIVPGSVGSAVLDDTASCDDGLAEDGDAEAFARAIGLCARVGAGSDSGLVSATFTRGYQRDDVPVDTQHGILPKFGDVIRPREGSKLGVLSTGYAREFDGPLGTEAFHDGAGGYATGDLPPGFPKPADPCPQGSDTNDVIDVKLVLKAPAGATGFQFDFNFWSSEWPAYVCSEFNDGFIAYLTSKGTTDNISFDAKKNPVSVNNGFFDRCTPNVQTGCSGEIEATSQCPGGPAELAGTGFGMVNTYCSDSSVSGGATGWLTSTAPIEGGETFTLEFMIWNTGDHALDSSVLLDRFRWIGGAPVSTETTRPIK